MGRSGGPWLGLLERLAPPGFADPPFRDADFGPQRRPIPPAGGLEAGRLHSHGPWDCRRSRHFERGQAYSFAFSGCAAPCVAFPGRRFAAFAFPGRRFAFPGLRIAFPGRRFTFPGRSFAFPGEAVGHRTGSRLPITAGAASRQVQTCTSSNSP